MNISRKPSTATVLSSHATCAPYWFTFHSEGCLCVLHGCFFRVRMLPMRSYWLLVLVEILQSRPCRLLFWLRTLPVGSQQGLLANLYRVPRTALYRSLWNMLLSARPRVIPWPRFARLKSWFKGFCSAIRGNGFLKSLQWLLLWVYVSTFSITSGRYFGLERFLRVLDSRFGVRWLASACSAMANASWRTTGCVSYVRASRIVIGCLAHLWTNTAI